MKFKMDVMVTQFEVDAACAFLEKERLEIPKGMADDVKQTGPASKTFYVVAKDDNGGILGVGKLSPYDIQAKPDGPVKVETIYMRQFSDFVANSERTCQFLESVLDICKARQVSVVLTREWLAHFARAGKKKRATLMITQSEADEARAFLERNHFEIPEGMADDVRQTGPTSQTFYVMDRNTNGSIFGVAKISPYDIQAEPGGPVKIEAVYIDKGCRKHSPFYKDILRVCADRKVPGIVLETEEMGFLSA